MARPLFPEDLEHVLEHTRDLWEEMRGRRIFVTGGTGFFGKWLLETFAFANDKLALDASMVCLTRDPEAFAREMPHLGGHRAVSFQRGDVRDFEFPSGEFSHVIHAATTASVHVEPLEMLDTIIVGTRRTLEFAAKIGAKKFLLTSSGAVYGKQPTGMTHVPESYIGGPVPSSPGAAYAEGKRVAELLCAIYSREHGIESKIARCFAFVGPHLPLDAHFAVGNFLRDALRGESIHVKGDGIPYRSYLYAADLAIWLWTILFQGKNCQPYNVGSGDALSIVELANTVLQALTLDTGVYVENEPTPGVPIPRYVPDVSLAEKDLKLSVRISLKNAIQRSSAWFRA